MSDNKQFRRHYKYNNLDAEELRKRREDTSIMLRKQKREDQVREKKLKKYLLKKLIFLN